MLDLLEYAGLAVIGLFFITVSIISRDDGVSRFLVAACGVGCLLIIILRVMGVLA